MSLLKAPQSTQPKKPQRGGPVAQDQTSIQRKKPQGGRRARRPGPVVHPTKEPRRAKPPRPPNQRTARPVASGRATVRTVHYFHSTAQPQISNWSGTGLRWWSTNDNGNGRLSQDTSGLPEKGVEAPRTESLKSQRLPSQRLVSSQRFDGLQRSQSLQSQRLETNQGASRSSQSSQRLTSRATHLTQWAMLNDQSHGSSSGCRLKEACCAKRSFFNPQGWRPKGVLSLTEVHRAVRKVRSTSGERRSLGTHTCNPREEKQVGQGECMFAPLGNGVSELSANMHSIIPCPKKTHGRGH